MGNIIDYVKEYGNRTFLQKVFNSVDSLVLSQLSYLKYEGIVCGENKGTLPVTLKDIQRLKDQKYNALFRGVLDVKSNMILLKEVADNIRYQNIELCCYESVTEDDTETQFAAMIFILDPYNYYIAFRGTDETLTGWKEDFNMAFLSPVPAQEKAVVYIEKHRNILFNKRFYIGGHSKGGNLSVYAAMHMEENLQNRIRKVYSLDGPGFKEGTLKQKEFQVVSHKICKILPRSSLIGMLLENQETYQVIESKKRGILKHDPFNWEVDNGDFIYLKQIDKTASIMDRTCNEWIQKMNDETRKKIVSTVFDVLDEAKLDDATEVITDWKSVILKIIEAVGEQDDETKKMLFLLLKRFIRISMRQIWMKNTIMLK